MASNPPQSPCINVCAMGPGGYCTGCYRTIEEIARWRSSSAGEQWAVLKDLPRRVVACAAESE